MPALQTSEVFVAAPVFHFHHGVKRLAKVPPADGKKPVAIDQRFAGAGDDRRNTLRQTAGADFPGHYRRISQEPHPWTILPAVADWTLRLLAEHAHHNAEPGMAVKDHPGITRSINTAMGEKLAGCGDSGG